MLRLVAPLFAPQLIAFTLVFGAVQAAEAGAFGDTWRPGGPTVSILWGERAHGTPDELAEWLGDRGRTYELWAKRHPQAAVELERAAIANARSRDAATFLPIPTSTLVLFILVLTSVSVLAATSSVSALPGRVSQLWRKPRVRYVFWPAGIASAVLLGLLAARVV